MSGLRILVTGSRTWDVYGIIWNAIASATQGQTDITLVSGHCGKGADAICERVAADMGIDLELHPANWLGYGKQAGLVRNTKMVRLGADLVLAFVKDGSKGATHCYNLAVAKGLHVKIWYHNSKHDGFNLAITEKEYNA